MASRVRVAAGANVASASFRRMNTFSPRLDLAALLDAGIKLEEALAAAQALYRDQFNPMISLKALTCFGDGDLPRLPKAIQNQLCQQAANVREIGPRRAKGWLCGHVGMRSPNLILRRCWRRLHSRVET